ncbi:hypothetical protein IKG29_00300 [Candidatus Saccharibacteria bacterium]|nr:hypothetical protein [Candidatus Saccharibacteria bacterium]MBR3328962.1 hypothetical protein [Candidatus Saccharibacteria bacterium]
MNEKFVLLKDDTRKFGDVELYRIRALKEFETMDGRLVEQGQLGGYVQSEQNLSEDGKAWVADFAYVFGNAVVKDDALVMDEALVSDDAVIKENAIIRDNARVFGFAIVEGFAVASEWCRIGGRFIVSGHSEIYGKARIGGSGTGRIDSVAQIYGFANIYSAYHIGISGKAQIYDCAHIIGGCKICDSARVHGKVRISGNGILIRDNAEVSGEAQILHSAYIGDEAFVSSIRANEVIIRDSSWICGNAHIVGKEDYRFVYFSREELTFFKNDEGHIIVSYLDNRGVREDMPMEIFVARHKRNKILTSEVHAAKIAMESGDKQH